jgi:electron transfer flavoprotein alpha/beta subunit
VTQPLTREQLHELAVRRRGDADVKTLLLEMPAIIELSRQPYGKPRCPEREQRFPHMSEREEKQLERQGGGEAVDLESERRPVPKSVL